MALMSGAEPATKEQRSDSDRDIAAMSAPVVDSTPSSAGQLAAHDAVGDAATGAMLQNKPTWKTKAATAGEVVLDTAEVIAEIKELLDFNVFTGSFESVIELSKLVFIAQKLGHGALVNAVTLNG